MKITVPVTDELSRVVHNGNICVMPMLFACANHPTKVEGGVQAWLYINGHRLVQVTAKDRNEAVRARDAIETTVFKMIKDGILIDHSFEVEYE